MPTSSMGKAADNAAHGNKAAAKIFIIIAINLINRKYTHETDSGIEQCLANGTIIDIAD